MLKASDIKRPSTLTVQQNAVADSDSRAEAASV